MSETNQPQPQNHLCKICGKEVFDNGTGGVVHAGGGTTMQRCKNCGWTGGQIGKFVQCPRCGDCTSLVDDHNALI